jgi:hypothetical protein
VSTQAQFQKATNVEQLADELRRSSLSTLRLEHVTCQGETTVVAYWETLDQGQMNVLTSVVASHVPQPAGPSPEPDPLQGLPRDDLGNLKVCTWFPALGYIPVFWGYKFRPIVGETFFYDIHIPSALRIWGGKAFVRGLKDGDDGDYLEFSIVDKDDVLGLFGVYGIQPPQVLQIKKFVRTMWIRRQSGPDHVIDLVPPPLMGDPLYPGLYMRVAYVCDAACHTPGDEPPYVNIELRLFEP